MRHKEEFYMTKSRYKIIQFKRSGNFLNYFFKTSTKKSLFFFSNFLWDLLYLKHRTAIAGTIWSTTRGKLVDKLLTLNFQYFHSKTEYKKWRYGQNFGIEKKKGNKEEVKSLSILITGR